MFVPGLLAAVGAPPPAITRLAPAVIVNACCNSCAAAAGFLAGRRVPHPATRRAVGHHAAAYHAAGFGLIVVVGHQCWRGALCPCWAGLSRYADCFFWLSQGLRLGSQQHDRCASVVESAYIASALVLPY